MLEEGQYEHVMGNTAQIQTQRTGRANGFTLVEVVVVIAVLAVLASMAIPGYRELVLNSKQRAATNELLVAMNAGRNEAIKQSRTVVVCASSGVTGGCAASSGNTSAWKNGVLVFVDEDGDDSLDDDETVSFFSDGYGAGLKDISGPALFRFRPFNVRGDAGTVMVCDSRGANHARAILVNVSGRAHTAYPGEAGISWSCPS